jgi:LPS export ABC transporter protein LptC
VTAARRWLLTLAAAAVAASAWLYLDARGAHDTAAGAARAPQLLIDQPRWKLYDASGRVDRRLSAQRLEQWEGKDGAQLVEPRLVLHDARQRDWQLRAASGVIYADRRPIMLHRDVELTQLSPGGLTARTRHLQLGRNGQRMKTDSAVELESGNWRFTADGMRANLGEQRLQLLGNVRGMHE